MGVKTEATGGYPGSSIPSHFAKVEANGTRHGRAGENTTQPIPYTASFYAKGKL